jgi:hypothetical protein
MIHEAGTSLDADQLARHLVLPASVLAVPQAPRSGFLPANAEIAGVATLSSAKGSSLDLLTVPDEVLASMQNHLNLHLVHSHPRVVAV